MVEADSKNSDDGGHRFSVKLFSKARIPTVRGEFDLAVYHCGFEKSEAIVISRGIYQESTISGQSSKAVFLRIHSECFTGEVLASQKCDCNDQLNMALDRISDENRGLVIYLRQEGRGIGLANKIKAYELQEKRGLDTVQANEALGFAEDLRDFTYAAMILKSLKIYKVRLNTNNPDKISSLIESGLEVSQVIPSITEPNFHNTGYLKTKVTKMGHDMSKMFPGSEVHGKL